LAALWREARRSCGLPRSGARRQSARQREKDRRTTTASRRPAARPDWSVLSALVPSTASPQPRSAHVPPYENRDARRRYVALRIGNGTKRRHPSLESREQERCRSRLTRRAYVRTLSLSRHDLVEEERSCTNAY